MRVLCVALLALLVPAPAAPGCVNINPAAFEDLQRIIHIGPDRAAEIIRLRPFSSVDSLDRVAGIGPSRLADIKREGIASVSCPSSTPTPALPTPTPAPAPPQSPSPAPTPTPPASVAADRVTLTIV